MSDHCPQTIQPLTKCVQLNFLLKCWTAQNINSSGRYFILKVDMHTQVCRYHVEYHYMQDIMSDQSLYVDIVAVNH